MTIAVDLGCVATKQTNKQNGISPVTTIQAKSMYIQQSYQQPYDNFNVFHKHIFLLCYIVHILANILYFSAHQYFSNITLMTLMT